MNTPILETSRLILRKFTERDMEALFLILKDEEANKFLPWYPVKDLEETRRFYQERYAAKYGQPQAYAYAICLKTDNFPIGYVKVDMEEHHDFGYGLRKEFWHRGIATEAGGAVIAQVRKDGLPYITATHDRNNPRSGNVMRLLVYDVICAPQASLFVALPAAHDISGFFEFLYRFADCVDLLPVDMG